MRVNELAVIGCILLDNKVINDIYNIVSPFMFTDNLAAETYKTMLAMHDRAETIDIVKLSASLVDNSKDYEDVSSFLADCVANVVSSVEAKNNAEIINKCWKVSELKNFFNNLKIDTATIDNALSDMSNKCLELANNQEKQFETLAETNEANAKNYFTEKEEKKIHTGFSQIDNYIYFEGGDLVVVGARPGVGKSAFITQVMCNIAEQGYKVGYFNLEMSSSQFLERVLSRYSGISLTRIRKAKHYLGDEKERFEKAREKAKMDNFLICSGANKVSDIKAKCRNQDFDIIVIDYLQLVRADRTFNNRASEVGEISKSIKALAMELKVPIIALSQMNRENDENSEPNISDLRESGDIEQDASIICLMWNLKNGTKGFKIGKNRQGELAKIGLNFNGDIMSFEETEFNDKEEYKKEVSRPWA